MMPKALTDVRLRSESSWNDMTSLLMSFMRRLYPRMRCTSVREHSTDSGAPMSAMSAMTGS